jgi:DNA replication and repair protein RecF
MFLRQLHIINYKNHEKKLFSFNEKINCFVGLNGVGKTNVLDAIYFLCIGKSYFSSTDKQCMNLESDFFRLDSTFVKEGETKQIIVKFEKGKRKKIEVNEEPVLKLAEHVGKYPIVVVAPNDNVLILGGSEERRKYMDETLAQADKMYLSLLNEYQKILAQRNALLKNAEEGNVNKNLLDIYNKQLEKPSQYVFEARKNFINEIIPFFNEAYKLISGNKEKFELIYKSDLQENAFFDLMQKNLHKDVILQRTTKGIHKDDIEFVMNSEMIKSFGSQGQQKTFLLALKLGQFNYLKSKKNIYPIFLMDDIFDKLDKERGAELLKTVTESLNQVFITHTDKQAFEKLMGNKKYSVIEI